MSRTIFSDHIPREMSQNMLGEGRRGQQEAVPATASPMGWRFIPLVLQRKPAPFLQMSQAMLPLLPCRGFCYSLQRCWRNSCPHQGHELPHRAPHPLYTLVHCITAHRLPARARRVGSALGGFIVKLIEMCLERKVQSKLTQCVQILHPGDNSQLPWLTSQTPLMSGSPWRSTHLQKLKSSQFFVFFSFLFVFNSHPVEDK